MTFERHLELAREMDTVLGSVRSAMSMEMMQSRLVGLDPEDAVVKRLLAAVEDQLTVKEVTESLALILANVDDVDDERAFAEMLLAELAEHGLTIVRG